MEATDKINELRAKLNSKKENPCPTATLFYIATNRHCLEEVNPWYEQISELCNGANRDYGSMHRAVVCALYPELEKAVDMFDEKMDQLSKSDDKSPEAIKKLEQDVIAKCGLKQAYNFEGITLSEEQKEKYDSLVEKYQVAKMRKKTKGVHETVQVIADAVAKNKGVAGMLLSSFANSMQNVSEAIRFCNGERTDEPDLNTVNSVKTFHNLYMLRDKGILGEKFEIVDFEGFRNSDFIKRFKFFDREFDLSDKVSKPEKGNVKSTDMVNE